MNHRSPILPIAAFVLVAAGLMGLWLIVGPRGPEPEVVAPPAGTVSSSDVVAPAHDATDETAETATRAAVATGTRAVAEAAPGTTWIRGQVLRSDNQNALGGVRIAVVARHGPVLTGADVVAQATSGADGGFELAQSQEPSHWRLGNGPLGGTLLAEHPGFAPAQRHFDARASAPIQTSLLLEPAAVLTGRLVDSRGEPVADALVLCGQLAWTFGEGVPKGVTLPSDTTDSRGHFRLAFVRTSLGTLEPDDVPLAVRFEHGALGQGHHALPGSTALSLQSSVGERDVHVGDVPFPVAASEASVVVTLRDPEGEPLAGMDFELVGKGNRRFYRRAQTDRLGRVHWTAPRGAELTMRQILRPSNVQATRPERSLVLDGAGVASGPALEPWPIRRLRVRMLDAEGVPVEGATVGVDDGAPSYTPFGSPLRTTPTDAEDWTADMPVLVNPQATVIGIRPSGGVARTALAISKTPHLTVLELRLEPELGTLVRVQTGAPLGKPPHGVALNVIDVMSGTVLQTGARSVAANRLELRLPRGECRLEVERAPPWFLPPPTGVAFAVESGGTLDVEVPFERAALLVLVPTDAAALAALRSDTQVRRVDRDGETAALRAPRVGVDALAPRFVFPSDGGGAPRLSHPVAIRLEPGRWAMRWRMGPRLLGEEVWIGEVDVALNTPARVDLGAPPAMGPGRKLELCLERR
ncbi:MAG: hypothetical protein GC161_10920 [Planctomycetaceae bacterium]|nr:hypothetical protein [Planctomycetaceae bacterium]